MSLLLRLIATTPVVPPVVTPTTGGGGGGHISDSRTPAKVERDRRREWARADERRADIRRQIMAVVEPEATEKQLDAAEQSDAAAIKLAERIAAKPDTLTAAEVQTLLALVRELQAAVADLEAQRVAAQQEEEAILLLLLAA